jgi:hypothetical protein
MKKQPPHPYDTRYAGGIKSAKHAERHWIGTHLRKWVGYPTMSAIVLERRMGLIDALADLLNERKLPDQGGRGW